MPDPTNITAPKDTTEPTQICNKCRGRFTLDHFLHGILGQGAVCKRCLSAMGYRIN